MTGKIKEEFNWKKELDTCQVLGWFLVSDRERKFGAKSNGSNFLVNIQVLFTCRTDSVQRQMSQHQVDSPSPYI